MWTRTINIFPEKVGDTSLRITILDANKDRSSSNADTRLVNTSLSQEIFPCCVKKIIDGTSYHYPRNLEELDHLLGRNWDKRILNPSGAYAYIDAYIVEDTVLISVSRRRPIKEYMYQGGGYIAVENEQHPAIIFKCF